MPDWDGIERRIGVASRRAAADPWSPGRRRSDYSEQQWREAQRWSTLTRSEKIAELRESEAWARRQRGVRRLELQDALMANVALRKRLQSDEIETTEEAQSA